MRTSEESHRGNALILTVIALCALLVVFGYIAAKKRNTIMKIVANRAITQDKTNTASAPSGTSTQPSGQANSNQAIDAKMKSLDAESASVDNSLNDKPIDVLSQ